MKVTKARKKPGPKPKPKPRVRRPGREKSNQPAVPGTKYRPAVMEPLDPKYRKKVVRRLTVTDTPTPVDLDCVLVPMSSPRSMGRPSAILLKWPRDTTTLDRAVRYGFQTLLRERHRDPPHFGIGQDGTVVQFLDPTRNGSGMCERYDKLQPSSAITIVQLQSRDVGMRPSAAQVQAVGTLISKLSWLYGIRPGAIVEDPEWRSRSMT